MSTSTDSAEAKPANSRKAAKKHLPAFGWVTLKRLKSSPGSIAITSFILVVPLLSVAAVIARQHGIDIRAPVNMLALYIGSLAYWIASFIVEISCPRIIKEYVSKYAFEEACLSSEMRNREFAKEPSQLMKSATQAAVVPGKDQQSDPDPKRQAQAVMRQATVLAQPKAMRDLWDKKSQESDKLRLLLTVLYLCSFAAMLYVTLIDAPIRVWGAWTPPQCQSLFDSLQHPDGAGKSLPLCREAPPEQTGQPS